MTERSLRALMRRCGTFPAVDDTTLNTPDGCIACLLGSSGCGKTKLLRRLGWLEAHSAGQVFVSGQDRADVPPHKHAFGMVFQSLARCPRMTVAENVAYSQQGQGCMPQVREEAFGALAA